MNDLSSDFWCRGATEVMQILFLYQKHNSILEAAIDGDLLASCYGYGPLGIFLSEISVDMH